MKNSNSSKFIHWAPSVESGTSNGLASWLIRELRNLAHLIETVLSDWLKSVKVIILLLFFFCLYRISSYRTCSVYIDGVIVDLYLVRKLFFALFVFIVYCLCVHMWTPHSFPHSPFPVENMLLWLPICILLCLLFFQHISCCLLIFCSSYRLIWLQCVQICMKISHLLVEPETWLSSPMLLPTFIR